MAVPLAFEPKPINPKKELQHRLDAAPVEHGEALLVLYDLLQEMHDKRVLDALVGLVSARDKIFEQLAAGAKTEEVIAGLRNAISLAKVLGSIDPAAMSSAANASAPEKVPGWWEILRRATSVDARRGISFTLGLVQAVGKRK